MINSILIHRYAKLSNLGIVARSSRRMIKKALGYRFGSDWIKISSYLLLSLCFKEYCHANSLAIDRFGIDEFETIVIYYNRLACDNSDRLLSIFSSAEARLILDEVGGYLRSIVSAEELSVASKDRDK